MTKQQRYVLRNRAAGLCVQCPHKAAMRKVRGKLVRAARCPRHLKAQRQ